MKINKEILFPLLSALFITLFLFYIDEGYYNFNWMLKASNWAAFIIYFVPLFGIPFLLIQFLKKYVTVNANYILSITLGSMVALFLVISALTK
ncbi:MAG: hypothetical protein WCI53_09885 [Bacteroidota bacterium]|jgi:hypothetical protein